ncbi:hypothetical protein CDD80_1332 [Ophiocordyceps camponoti-rufipedis]|uniref:Uncharacterized protein n=1 Tax=Ophiocordyceps camponoti-rufipedis TaxID=2004952 RepID=A0A2C5ZBA8_9HYPO|nr:hypothetical protein CDD80_1332 [Ophiocordyceps camponoti-rufipedis]
MSYMQAEHVLHADLAPFTSIYEYLWPDAFSRLPSGRLQGPKSVTSSKDSKHIRRHRRLSPDDEPSHRHQTGFFSWPRSGGRVTATGLCRVLIDRRRHARNRRGFVYVALARRDSAPGLYSTQSITQMGRIARHVTATSTLVVAFSPGSHGSIIVTR